MAQIYINDISVNNGLSLHGQTPLDDRLVWEGLNSLYLSVGSPKDCPFYGQAYKGMVITLFEDDKRYLLMLKDETPYTPGLEQNINASNWENFWQSADADIEHHVDVSVANINASINDISNRLKNSVQHLEEEDASNFSALTTSINNLRTYTDGSLGRINTSIGKINTSINDVITAYKAADTSIYSGLSSDIDDVSSYVRTTVDGSVNRIDNFVKQTLNPSVNAIETYLKTNNIPNSNESNGLTITGTLGTTGYTYDFMVNTDSSTIAIVDDVVTGGRYKIVRDASADADDSNLYSKYYLRYIYPGTTALKPIDSDVIEVPKARVVKNAFLCKAVEDSGYPGGYRITSKQGEAAWATDTNPVYFCIEWDLNPGNEDTLYDASDGITFIKLEAAFNDAFKNIDASITDVSNRLSNAIDAYTAADSSIFSGLNTSIGNLRTYTDGSLGRINTSIGNLNVSIGTVVTNYQAADSSIYSGLNTEIGNVQNYVDTTVVVNYKLADASIYSGLKSYIDGSVGTLNTKINDLSTYVNTNIKTQINDLSTNVNTTIKTQINDLSTNINQTITTQIGTVTT